MQDNRRHPFCSGEHLARILPGDAEYVLSLASSQGYRCIVLGAWGCGVYRNNPETVADVFMRLPGSAEWANRFSRLVFSILDPSPGQSLIEVFKAAVRGR